MSTVTAVSSASAVPVISSAKQGEVVEKTRNKIKSNKAGRMNCKLERCLSRFDTNSGLCFRTV